MNTSWNAGFFWWSNYHQIVLSIQLSLTLPAACEKEIVKYQECTVLNVAPVQRTWSIRGTVGPLVAQKRLPGRSQKLLTLGRGALPRGPNPPLSQTTFFSVVRCTCSKSLLDLINIYFNIWYVILLAYETDFREISAVLNFVAEKRYIFRVGNRKSLQFSKPCNFGICRETGNSCYCFEARAGGGSSEAMTLFLVVARLLYQGRDIGPSPWRNCWPTLLNSPLCQTRIYLIMTSSFSCTLKHNAF